MPALKKTVRYEARQRLMDAVVVRRSETKRQGSMHTVEDIVCRYTELSTASSVAVVLNDARPHEVHHS